MFGLFSRLIVINAAIIALCAEAWNEGWLTNVQNVDDFHVCKVMAVILIFGLCYALRQAWWLERQDYCTTSSLEMARRFGVVRDIANTIASIGLTGTLLGFYVALSGVNADAVGDLASAGPMIGTLLHGMAMSLVKTLLGSVFNIWLMFNYRMLVNDGLKIEVATNVGA